MTSLRECVACKDMKDTTYLLPCLHPTCSQCAEEIVQEANHKKRKRPSCCDCGESFVQDKLTTVPTMNNNSTLQCAECGANATHFCRDCNEHLCKPHGEPHSTTRRFKGHVVQLVAEMPCCSEHSAETAIAFCIHCKILVCGPCGFDEHSREPHLSISLDKVTDFIKTDVDKLLESIPAIDEEIKMYIDVRSKLEKDRSLLEAKIGDIRNQEKVTILQLEDLENTRALLLTAQTQANALASTASVLSQAASLRLQSVVATRVANLRAGLDLISGSTSSTRFNRVSQHFIVSKNGKTITNAGDDWGYGISDDGCSSGIRSWRITINKIGYGIMFGIWNSSGSPTHNESFEDDDAWIVSCNEDGDSAYKAGERTGFHSSCSVQSGDVILLTVDADIGYFSVNNTTRGWTYTIDDLPLPNPAYYPHLLLCDQNDSITIEVKSLDLILED